MPTDSPLTCIKFEVVCNGFHDDCVFPFDLLDLAVLFIIGLLVWKLIGV